ncbi:hypothetical protein [Haladaptatus sp. NG-SE-30]
MSDESRADRLRRRRRAQREQTEPDEPSESSKRSEASKTSKMSEQSVKSKTSEMADSSEHDETDGTDEQSKAESVKDARVGTYMYLPEDQRSKLNFRYKELNLTYERSFGEELEKNRHFYPLVVQAGLEALDGLDGEELRERLSRLE